MVLKLINNKQSAFTLVEMIINLWLISIIGFILVLFLQNLIQYEKHLTDLSFVRWQSAMKQMETSFEKYQFKQCDNNRIVFKTNDKIVFYRKYKDQIVESVEGKTGETRGYKPIIFGLQKIEFSNKDNYFIVQGIGDSGEKQIYIWPKKKAG